MQLQIPDVIREKARILVVEDNLLNQKLDAFLLSRWGLHYEICDNGRDAISSLRNRQFSLVLMDLRMPALTGLEATRVIRTELALDVPVIGVTAYPTEEEKQKCMEAGMNTCLNKPVDEDELLRQICMFLVPEQVEEVQDEEE